MLTTTTGRPLNRPKGEQAPQRLRRGRSTAPELRAHCAIANAGLFSPTAGCPNSRGSCEQLPSKERACAANSAAFSLANQPGHSYLACLADMSWKRAQAHAESMLDNLGLGERLKGRKDLRGKKVIFVDDGSDTYRTMCFTIAAKLVKRRGADPELVKPGPGEASHVKVVDQDLRPKPRAQRPINRR